MAQVEPNKGKWDLVSLVSLWCCRIKERKGISVMRRESLSASEGRRTKPRGLMGIGKAFIRNAVGVLLRRRRRPFIRFSTAESRVVSFRHQEGDMNERTNERTEFC